MVQLVTIATGHQLAQSAAASYSRICRALGRTVEIPKPLGAFRTFAQQAELRHDYLTGSGSYALPPGWSQHELGLAMDVGPAYRSWMASKNGGRAHGWVRTNPAEKWHFEYRIALDQHLLDDITPPTPPTRKKAPTMFVTPYGKAGPDQAHFLVTGDRIVQISKAGADALRASGIPYVVLPNTDTLTLRQQLTSEKG